MSDDLKFLNENFNDAFTGWLDGCRVINEEHNEMVIYRVVEYKEKYYEGSVFFDGYCSQKDNDFYEVKPVEKTIIEYAPV